MPEEKNESSLLSLLDYPQTNCLNEAASPNTLRSIIDSRQLNKSPAFLLSDADEQLLLNIHFNQTVRPRALILKTSEGNISQGPKIIKIFTNRPSIGFEDVEQEAAQIIQLTEEQVKAGTPILLKYVRFQSVNSLHIFVESNFGEDITRIDAIDVIGSPASAGGTKDLRSLGAENDG